MPASIEQAVIALTARGGAPDHEQRVREMRRAFERRTGPFGVDDAWFDARSAAFWDDALVGGFARAVMAEVSDVLHPYVGAIESAHRGLYAVHRKQKTLLECAVTGAVLAIDPPRSPGLADALERADGFVQGFVAGACSPEQVALLPGAVFHAPEASAAIEALLPIALERAMPEPELFDALLRMDRTLRAMPRAKAQLAYRAEALALRAK
jgi:hypothetical protein